MDIYERKLMLVDDNQELLEMIADILRHSGYKNIVKAKCVQEALTVFQMEKPDMAGCCRMETDFSCFRS